MLATYKAILRGNQLEWHEQIPPQLAQQPVAVYVTLLDVPITATEKSVQGAQMAAALTALATLQSESQTIVDPIAWEREQRQDRSLPHRP